MQKARSYSIRLAASLLGLIVLAFVSGTRADAVATSPTTDPLQAAAGWLANQFEDSTHLPAPSGDHFDSKFGSSYFPSYGTNADVIFGLAAAGAGKDKMTTALGYLATNLDAYADISAAAGGPYDGSIAKVALAAQVAGSDATAFGGSNLLAQLKADECTAATVPYDQFGDTVCAAPGAAKNIFSSVSESLAILTEARAGGIYTPSAAAVTYIDSLQCPSGGFSGGITACVAGDEDIDATSYAIMALSLLTGQATHLANAVTWLHGQQNPAGYWVTQSVPNVNSTGLAVAALKPQSVNVASARSWLLSQQVAAGAPGAGAFKYAGAFTATTTSAFSPSILATAQALGGLIDGASLATVSATGATSGTSAFAPSQNLSAATAVQGSTQTVTGNGFAPGEQVQAVIHSAPVTVGSAVADAAGTVSISYVVPAGVDPGAHTLVLTGLTSGLSVSSALAITAAPVAPAIAPAANTAASADDPLANTGLDGPALATLGAFGAFGLLFGSMLLVVARRRSA
jgi:hypothetical protein